MSASSIEGVTGRVENGRPQGGSKVQPAADIALSAHRLSLSRLSCIKIIDTVCILVESFCSNQFDFFSFTFGVKQFSRLIYAIFFHSIYFSTIYFVETFRPERNKYSLH